MNMILIKAILAIISVILGIKQVKQEKEEVAIYWLIVANYWLLNMVIDIWG